MFGPAGFFFAAAFFVGSGSTCTSSGNSWCSSMMTGAGASAFAFSAASFAALAAFRSAASFLLYSIIAAVDPNRPAGAGLLLSTCKQLNKCDFVG